MTLNFDGGADDIPTYSFADLLRLRRKGRQRLLPSQLSRTRSCSSATVLDVEDRNVTSKRFATSPEDADRRCAARCRRRRGVRFARNSIAGVYIHATAVNNLHTRRCTGRTRPQSAVRAMAVAFAAIAAAGSFDPALVRRGTRFSGRSRLCWTCRRRAALSRIRRWRCR